MNVTVYRQASVTRDDGTVVFKGEDALPCVGGSFFFVADGMGGGAAIRHQKFDPDLFDREKLMDALFETVYEDYSDERFVRYVTGSFEELYAVRNCYTANVYNMKKSGFFGGRLAAAIFLHMAVYGEVIGPVDRLFDDWAALPGEPERAAFLEKLSGDVTAEFREKLQAIAQKANLVYESGIRGMDLLGTTLTATLFREADDGVEALYLTAGDSRPYAWSAEEGLCQLLPDQERGDGGMTNRITANKDFRIHCSILTFRKPCVLFNASDGCFDSDYFRLSQMAFEKLLLERACEASGTEEMGRLLTDDFTTMGTHDDSSTIAMKIFGYAAFEDFRADARKRLDILEAEYLSRLDGLLEKDFAEAKKEQEKQLPERLAALKTRFEEEPVVAAFCRTAVESGAYPPYDRECETLEEKEAELNARLDRLTNTLKEQIRRCYCCFLSDMELNMLRQERWTPLPGFVKKIEKYKNEINRLETEYRQILEKHRQIIPEAGKQLGELLEAIGGIGVPFGFSAYQKIWGRQSEACKRALTEAADFVGSLALGEQKQISELRSRKHELCTVNLTLSGKKNADVARIAEELLSGQRTIDEASMHPFEEEAAAMRELLAEIGEVKAEIEGLRGESEELLGTCGAAYWEENYTTVMETLSADGSAPLSAELREETEAVLTRQQELTAELSEKASLQAELLGAYEKGYNRYLGEEEE